MKSFVNLVAAKLNSQRLSIRKVAKDAGLDPSFLSKVLTGKRSPPTNEKLLRKLAKILGMDPMLLIISTGTIPTELQPLMEKPEFYKKILSGMPNSTAKLNEVLSINVPAKEKEKKQIRISTRSSDLPEDLL